MTISHILLCSDNDNEQKIQEIAKSTSHLGVDVLLSGETGTGKDTLAEKIHKYSMRSGKFVAMNCAAIPETLAESQLFGVISGAFTGATRSRMGYIEAAHQGTLYLDEIDSMSLNLQAKLLRVLETRSVERLGSTESIALELRVIASSQRPLDVLVEAGSFRRDLYFRLSVLTMRLTPLRESRELILPLFESFVAIDSAVMKTVPKLLDSNLTQILLSHSWPGNIRELKSVAKRFVLGYSLLNTADRVADSESTLKIQLRSIERALINDALKRNEQSIDATSMELGVPKRTLYHRLRHLDIQCKRPE